MSSMELPVYDDAALKLRPIEQLIEVLVVDEDRVPRNVIDECVSRGASMIEALRPILASDESGALDDELLWVRLHAIMILGLMSTADAGELLACAMRRMDMDGDEDLQDWLAGYWPALFRNKPPQVLPAVAALMNDRQRNSYIRVQAAEVLLEASERRGPQAFKEQLASIAALGADEDPDMRMQAAILLLDFPRPEHRSLLERQARQPEDDDFVFSRDEVDEVYAAGVDSPQWTRFADPWEFYSADAIASRQKRWAEEYDEEFLDSPFDDELLPELPYVRKTSKVGRNDPCPCGSGKKYKKCCLANERDS
jgi:hypothetical protein